MELKTSLLYHPSTKLHETPKALPQLGGRQELGHKASPGPAHFPSAGTSGCSPGAPSCPQFLRAADELVVRPPSCWLLGPAWGAKGQDSLSTESLLHSVLLSQKWL